MKIRAFLFVSVLCATACLTGCFSIHSAQAPADQGEHLVVRNYGWYLLDFIPIGCGNASNNPWLPFVIFRDDVEMDRIQEVFTEYAALKGKKPTELTYDVKDDVMSMFPLLGYSVTIPIPYILTYPEIQLSGVLTK